MSHTNVYSYFKLTLSFKSFPGLKNGTLVFGSDMLSPVLGLRAVLAALSQTPKVPKPTNRTGSFLAKASAIFSKMHSTAALA